MKLNFWQWLGIVIVVIALVLIIRRETGERGGAEPSAEPTPEFSPDQAVEVRDTPATRRIAADPHHRAPPRLDRSARDRLAASYDADRRRRRRRRCGVTSSARTRRRRRRFCRG